MGKFWWWRETKDIYIKQKNNKAGITLIALIVTIIVLLILARYIDCNFSRRKWNIKEI